MRAACAGIRLRSPAVGNRAYSLAGGSPDRGSRMPACSVVVAARPVAMLCSTRICGVQDQRLPADDSAGYAVAAKEVGERGEKKGASCPAVTEVADHSIRNVAVRR